MPSERFSLRLDSALKAKLEAEAAKQRRSLNNLIELALEQWLRRNTEGESK